MTTRDPSPLNSAQEGSFWFVLLVCLVAAVGGLLFGFDSAITAGANAFLKAEFSLDADQEGWAVSCILVGCAVGAGFAGGLSDRFGRKKILLLAAVLFGASAVGAAVPRNLTEFALARFVGGLGIGVASMLSPLYIAEIAPARMRGRLVTLNQLAIITGILVAYLVSWSLAGIGPTNWRWMFGAGAFPAAVFFVLLMFVPESPRWLAKQGRYGEAVATLARVGGPRHAAAEMAEIKDAIAHEGGSVFQLLRPGLVVALTIGVVLAILQQITGINTVLYYAPRIFDAAGYSKVDALAQLVIIGLVNAVFTVVAIPVVDRLGRKKLLAIGAVAMGIFLTLSGIAFQWKLYQGPWIPLLILAYVASFAVTLGPVVWVVMAEIFPTRIRGRAMSIATVCLWVVNFIITLKFPPLVDKYGYALAFWFFAGMCAVTFVFVLFVVPETKGKSLEEIEKLWIR
ncbi:MAG: sugar porter family MFS transporter [Pirellulales bacterium]